MPAVVLKTSFVYKWDIGGFLDYMERPDAFRGKVKNISDEMYDYFDYMGNSEKSDGLFSATKNLLSSADVNKLRESEKDSMNKGCPKYLGVISFDNDFLRQNGLLIENYLDINKIKSIARKSISAMIEKSGKLEADNCYWTAAVHVNTENVHIHFQLLEKNRVTDRRITHKNKGQDKIEKAALEELKSTVVSEILTQKQTPMLTELKRKILLPQISENIFASSSIYRLVSELPETKTAWQYNRKNIRPFQREIDNCVDQIIENTPALKEDFEKFKKQLEKLSCDYTGIYGERKNKRISDYSENQMQDFYVRAGNQLLKAAFECKEKFSSKESKTENPPRSFKEKNETIQTAKTIHVSSSRYFLDWTAEYKDVMKRLYSKDKKSDDDLNDIISDLSSQAESGNILALYELGKLYSNDRYSFSNEEMSHSCYEQALKGFMSVENTNEKMRPYIQYRIGKMYCYGLGTEQDYEEAVKWLMESAMSGNKYAQFSLANLYYYGTGIEQDYEKAFYWYEKSAKKGQPFAAYAIAKMYSNGEYVSQSDESAYEYYRMALSGFHALEQKEQADENLFYKIAACYEKGLGTEVDMSKAVKYYKLSSDSGNDNASRKYAKALIEGEYIEKDFEKGIRLLTDLADKKGDELAAFSLGKIYLSKEHYDYKMALKYLDRNFKNETLNEVSKKMLLVKVGRPIIKQQLINKIIQKPGVELKKAAYIINTAANGIERLLRDSEAHLAQLQREYEYEQEQQEYITYEIEY